MTDPTSELLAVAEYAEERALAANTVPYASKALLEVAARIRAAIKLTKAHPEEIESVQCENCGEWVPPIQAGICLKCGHTFKIGTALPSPEREAFTPGQIWALKEAMAALGEECGQAQEPESEHEQEARKAYDILDAYLASEAKRTAKAGE